jgi:hypothetical protein
METFPQPQADGIAPRPQPHRERRADDGNVLRPFSIEGGKHTSADDRNAHRIEILRGDRAVARARQTRGVGRGTVLGDERRFRAPPRRRQDAGDRDLPDGRKGGQAIEQPLAKRASRVIVDVSRVGQRKVEAQEVAGLEAARLRRHAGAGVERQARADQQCQRARNLADDQRLADPLPSAPAGRPAVVFLQ